MAQLAPLLVTLACAASCSDGQAQPPPRQDGRIWGVTVDGAAGAAPTVDALARLPRRAMARVVFDEGQPAASYATTVRGIHRAADVMGEILDSQYVRDVSVADYGARTAEYLDLLRSDVDVWEIGNEVNGEWLGSTADVVAKLRSAYDLVRARGAATALTLYLNEGCWTSADHEMFAWTAANVPADIKAGVDYLLVSYYEDDCNGLQPDWAAVFARLAVMFPNAKLGIGECGTADPARKAAYLQRYYTMSVPEPRFVGGGFWWYFSEDMVPAPNALWQLLANLMRASG